MWVGIVRHQSGLGRITPATARQWNNPSINLTRLQRSSGVATQEYVHVQFGALRLELPPCQSSRVRAVAARQALQAREEATRDARLNAMSRSARNSATDLITPEVLLISDARRQEPTMRER